MLAREWAVAACHSPADYDIPELPAWRVRADDAGLVLAADDDACYLAADDPVRVRR